MGAYSFSSAIALLEWLASVSLFLDSVIIIMSYNYFEAMVIGHWRAAPPPFVERLSAGRMPSFEKAASRVGCGGRDFTSWCCVGCHRILLLLWNPPLRPGRLIVVLEWHLYLPEQLFACRFFTTPRKPRLGQKALKISSEWFVHCVFSPPPFHNGTAWHIPLNVSFRFSKQENKDVTYLCVCIGYVRAPVCLSVCTCCLFPAVHILSGNRAALTSSKDSKWLLIL